MKKRILSLLGLTFIAMTVTLYGMEEGEEAEESEVGQGLREAILAQEERDINAGRYKRENLSPQLQGTYKKYHKRRCRFGHHKHAGCKGYKQGKHNQGQPKPGQGCVGGVCPLRQQREAQPQGQGRAHHHHHGYSHGRLQHQHHMHHRQNQNPVQQATGQPQRQGRHQHHHHGHHGKGQGKGQGRKEGRRQCGPNGCVIRNT